MKSNILELNVIGAASIMCSKYYVAKCHINSISKIMFFSDIN